jgi:hypothetical protein
MSDAQTCDVEMTLLPLGFEMIRSNTFFEKYVTFVKVFFFCKEEDNKVSAA